MKKFSILLALLIALFSACEEDNNEPDIIEEENPELIASYSTTNVSEYNGNDGSITVNVTSGTKPYMYKLNDNNFQTNNKFDGLSADTFDVSVKDATDQLLVFNDIIITEPSLDDMVVEFDITNVSEYNGDDGKIVVNVTGGLPPYLYKLNDGDYNSNNTYNDLIAGDYTISVKDDLDSVKTETITITEPEYIEMDISVDVNDVSVHGGNDGSITINVEGGIPTYIYELSNGVYTGGDFTNFTFDNLSADTYTLTVKDQFDSIVINDIVVEQPDELIAGEATETGMGEITVSGTTGGVEPYEYSKDGGNNYQSSNVFSGLNEGTYTITIKDNSDVTVETNSVTLNGLKIGDEYLGGIIFEISGDYPNQNGKIVYNNSMSRKNWDNADNDCNTFVVDNNDNWRLPTKDELISILTKKYIDNEINNVNIYENYYHWTSNEGSGWNTHIIVGYSPTHGILVDEYYDDNLRHFIPVSDF